MVSLVRGNFAKEMKDERRYLGQEGERIVLIFTAILENVTAEF